jgi:hypothetical protein
LANVPHLKKYISKMIGMRWFDYWRKNVFWMKHLKEEKKSNGSI